MHSLFEGQSPENQLGKVGYESDFVNKHGLRINTYFYPATDKQAKAVILLVHGHGAYCQKDYLAFSGVGKPVVYKGSWIEAFNSAGYSCCGLDLQGHGKSDSLNGRRCYIETFDDYIDDVVHFGKIVKGSKEPSFQRLPLFICGLSLGGCISVSVIHKTGDLFKSAVLCAPMLSLERIANKGINKYLRPLAALIAWLFPAWPLGEMQVNTMFPHLQQEWDADPLVWKDKTRARNAIEYLKATEHLASITHTFTFPFIVFHSENDGLTDPAGSKRLYAQSQAKDKQLRLVNSMWHVLAKEPGNMDVHREILDWLDARL